MLTQRTILNSNPEITAQLLHSIQKVYIVARNRRKYEAAREDWCHQTGVFLDKNDDRTEFIQCDLADISSVKRAAEEIRHKTDRIHMVICNAGTSFPFWGYG